MKPSELTQQAIADPPQTTAIQDAPGGGTKSSATAEERLKLAIACIEQQDLAAARDHAVSASTLVDSNWPQLESLGILLFELSEFSSAYQILVRASQTGSLGAHSNEILAALFHRAGDAEHARQCMAATARLEPIVGPARPADDRPSVLRLRSAEKSHFGIKTDRETGLRYCRLKGGHFSDKHLIDLDRINLYVATFFGDNLRFTGELPRIDLFVNGVGCPDLDPVGLNLIDAFLAKYPNIPVINHPQKVQRTTRIENSHRLGVLPNVIMPTTELFLLDGSADTMADRIEQCVRYPMIVRHRGTQTGKTLAKIDDRRGLVEWISNQPPRSSVYASDFIDCRGKDGFYHKSRVFFIDGQLFPVANLASDSWQIHSGDRYRVMSSTPSTQDAEQRYLDDIEAYLGKKAITALHAIADKIDLEFFGIDFTVDPDGNVIVFEANAAMRHNFDHAENFPYTRPHLERISGAFAEMVDRRSCETTPSPTRV